MAPTSLFALYEHAIGYALFKVKEFEEIGLLQAEVEEGSLDLSKFNSIVSLAAFSPFANGLIALENMNSISEGNLHDDLKAFLESNVPPAKKKVQITLGVGDSKLGKAISDELGISCSTTGVVPEILRGLRAHFPKLLKGVTEISLSRAQLALGHSYSRAKVKFNVNKADNMIIQSVNLLDQMDKNINTFAMRVREWYNFHFPELAKIISDSHTYIKAVTIIGNRKELDDAKLAALEELLMDSAKVEAVVSASKSSMGMDINPIDLINVEMFAKEVVGLSDFKSRQTNYLQHKMTDIAPNLTALIGEQVGARLISKAGSLTNLSKCSASTVQILGAEKALFRALKTKSNTPKYGLIYHSTFIGKASAKNKGRISRYLANRCAMASRIDAYSEMSTSVYGEAMKQQVEKKLESFDSGEPLQPNQEVMSGAFDKVAKIARKMERKKRKSEAAAERADPSEAMEVELAEPKEVDVAEPKKKKKKNAEVDAESTVETPVAKKKNSDQGVEEAVNTPVSKKKKKKNAELETESAVETPVVKKTNADQEAEESVNTTVSKKKKKKNSEPEDEKDVVTPVVKKDKKTAEPELEEAVKTSESKKKKKITADENNENDVESSKKKIKKVENEEVQEKEEVVTEKKKKKRKSVANEDE